MSDCKNCEMMTSLSLTKHALPSLPYNERPTILSRSFSLHDYSCRRRRWKSGSCENNSRLNLLLLRTSFKPSSQKKRAAAADATQPTGCDSIQLPPPPHPQRHPVPHQPPPPSARHQPSSQQQQQNQQQQQSQTVHYYHDSNSDEKLLSLADIQNTFNTINKKQNKPTNMPHTNCNKHTPK